MRKFFAVVMVVLIAVCMAVSAYAVTPTIKVPEVKISDSFWDKWFGEHPLNIKLS